MMQPMMHMQPMYYAPPGGMSFPGYGNGRPAQGPRNARLSGVLLKWNADKACGWIESQGQTYFAHKSEFVPQFEDGNEPPNGTPLSFVLGVDAKSLKERAQNIKIDLSSSEDSGGLLGGR